MLEWHAGWRSWTHPEVKPATPCPSQQGLQPLKGLACLAEGGHGRLPLLLQGTRQSLCCRPLWGPCCLLSCCLSCCIVVSIIVW